MQNPEKILAHEENDVIVMGRRVSQAYITASGC